MEIFVNFTNPMLISKGINPDQVLCHIKNRYLFTSNVTGKVLDTGSLDMIKAFPKLLPKGVDEDLLKGGASNAGNAMKGLVFVQLIA